MKVEKVDDNKIKITLSFEELEMRNIKLSDIEKNNSAARKLFMNLIEEYVWMWRLTAFYRSLLR